jgi:DNA-directed RNA polymerase specialized sigma24 family protein
MTPIVSAETDNAPGRNWGQLMAAAQMGHADAYRTLLSELTCWLRRYYARRLPPAMTEDAVRDVLLTIHEKRHTYDPGHPFEPWLAAIARYKWIDRLRSLRFEAAEPRDENIGIWDLEAGVIGGSTFQQLLAQLKPRQAEAIRLVKLQGCRAEEASHATGQMNLHRGIKRLADIIEATDDADRFARRSSTPGAGPDLTAQRWAQSDVALATRLFKRAISTRSRKVICHD